MRFTILYSLLVIVAASVSGNVRAPYYEVRAVFGPLPLNEVEVLDDDWIEETEVVKKYEPNWASLDKRPLPAWYDQGKIGIFIHWGVYSVNGLGAWFWNHWKSGAKDLVEFMKKNYKPNTTYQEFASQFTAEFYNPVDWAKLFEKAGAKYVVLTSKHHEGYTLWPSKNSFSWNSQDVGPHRDLVGDLANAVRNNTNLRFGLYHSLFEFYNPLWLQDYSNKFSTDEFVRFKTMPELYDIVNTYRPDVIWSDGEWLAPDTYWKSQEFLAWLYNDSPVRDTVVTNDRWGNNTMCKHGGYYTCHDRFNPGTLQARKWENCFTLDRYAWAFRKTAKLQDYLTPEQLMTTIVETVSCGGNALVDVGPTKEGMIPVIQQERLLQMGEWLGINGEAIYNSVPYRVQNDTVTPGVWYTMNADKSKIFGMVTKWPKNGIITLGAVLLRSTDIVRMLGEEESLQWQSSRQGIVIDFPPLERIRSKWVWTLVFPNSA